MILSSRASNSGLMEEHWAPESISAICSIFPPRRIGIKGLSSISLQLTSETCILSIRITFFLGTWETTPSGLVIRRPPIPVGGGGRDFSSKSGCSRRDSMLSHF